MTILEELKDAPPALQTEEDVRAFISQLFAGLILAGVQAVEAIAAQLKGTMDGSTSVSAVVGTLGQLISDAAGPATIAAGAMIGLAEKAGIGASVPDGALEGFADVLDNVGSMLKEAAEGLE